MFVVRVTAVTDELVEAFARLIPQLKLNFPPPSLQELNALLLEQSGILDGDGRLLRKYLNHTGIFFRILSHPSVINGQCADDFIAHPQRHPDV